MRVRHLQSHLQEQGLVQPAKLDKLRGVHVGVDAVFWLRSIQALKDPFADALGGIPPGIFGFVDKELEQFKKYDIKPLFVFQGVAPGPQHSLFVSRMDQQMEMAWSFLAQDQKDKAQKCFAVSTSRINGDFVYFIYHHLRYRGYECLQAPYFAGAQLAHFVEQGVVQTVFGPPGLLLYGIPSVIIHLNFTTTSFDWVDLEAVLGKWGIKWDQFVEACMLAGTEYCLTYPYLNLNHFHPQQAGPANPQGRFNFDAAVSIIKQAPLINWMQTFPTEDMKKDHIDGYCICKVLVQNSPVLHLQDQSIRPLSAGTGKRDTKPKVQGVPADFKEIMGEQLPLSLYYLMLNGIISHKLPQALAKGEWTDKSQPLVDTTEFRNLLQELKDYREISLGLLARHLHENFQNKRILCKGFWEREVIRQSSCSSANLPPDARIIQPRIEEGLAWNIRHDQLEAELRRQGVDKVDFKFCLQWHAKEVDTEGPLITGITRRALPRASQDKDCLCLAALVHFMVLERLGLISEDGSATVLGNVLKDTPPQFQEPCLVALELMKFAALSGDPFENAERPFPEQVRYPKVANEQTKSTLLLCRVMSLVPMRLKNDMWNADVDFDLAAFHALLRVLKRSLRQLVEASLASVLIKNMDFVKLLPPGFMCASPNKKEDWTQTPALLPTFMLPRACMGIVVKFFMEYQGEPKNFAEECVQRFPCCAQPVEDLKSAFNFWEDLLRCIQTIAEPLDCEELAQDMQRATNRLNQQKKRLGMMR